MEPIFIHDIDPVFLRLGILELRYYGLLFFLGVLTLFFFMGYFFKQEGLKSPWQYAEDYIFYLFIGVVLGARLVHVLFYNPSYYFSNPISIFKIWEGGIASHGGVLGAFLATWIFSKRKDISFYSLADKVVIPFSLATMFVRFGNFLNAEIVGRISDVTWTVAYKFSRFQLSSSTVEYYTQKLPKNEWLKNLMLSYHKKNGLTEDSLNQLIESYTFGESNNLILTELNSLLSTLPRHPSQFYEMLFGLICFAILFWVYKKLYTSLQLPQGTNLYLALVIYFGFRFWAEFYKEYQGLSPESSFTMGQYLSLPLIGLGLGMLIHYFLRSQRRKRRIAKINNL